MYLRVEEMKKREREKEKEQLRKHTLESTPMKIFSGRKIHSTVILISFGADFYLGSRRKKRKLKNGSIVRAFSAVR